MGKVFTLTKDQEVILLGVAKSDFLRKQFYFTGGTALSAVYLQHRHSEDIDLFSEEAFDAQKLFEEVSRWVTQYDITITRRQTENVHMYLLTFPNGKTLKVDFVRHSYKRVEKGGIFEGVEVDSLLDIATNKLLTMNQRTEVKDFVDLYSLLKHYTIWDLIEGLRVKFRFKTEPFFVAPDFTKVEGFDVMSRMIKPLTLKELKSFFKDKAIEIGKRVVE